MANSPTSPEQYLEDAIYNLQALREISSTTPEPAIAGDQLFEDCSVFIDQNTGNRIVVTSLPLSRQDFSEAVVVISNLDMPIRFDTGNQVIEASNLQFWIDSNLGASVLDPNSGEMISVATDSLAEFLDMPRIKPYPVSEYDHRPAPPVIPRVLPYTESPKIHKMHYELATESDILRIPVEKLYTHMSSVLDEQDGTSATFEGLTSFSKQDHIFRLEVDEDEPDATSFDRHFKLRYQSLTGRIALGATLLGHTEPFMHQAQDFNFILTREGLSQEAVIDHRRHIMTPHESTALTLYLAALTGDRIE